MFFLCSFTKMYVQRNVAIVAISGTIHATILIYVVHLVVAPGPFGSTILRTIKDDCCIAACCGGADPIERGWLLFIFGCCA